MLMISFLNGNWQITLDSQPKMHHFQCEAGEKAPKQPNLGASPSLARMQREPGAWWKVQPMRTLPSPLSLKDGGHLGRILCWQENVEFLQTSFLSLAKRGIDVDISPTGFHKRNWEVVKSPVRVGEWFFSWKKKNTFRRFVREIFAG